MKLHVLWFAVLMNIAFIGGINLEKYYWKKSIKEQEKVLDAYRGYYVSTEHLLDIINNKWSWVDAFDHQGYYESKAKVEYHDSLGIALSQKHFQKVLDWEEQQNK